MIIFSFIFFFFLLGNEKVLLKKLFECIKHARQKYIFFSFISLPLYIQKHMEKCFLFSSFSFPSLPFNATKHSVIELNPLNRENSNRA